MATLRTQRGPSPLGAGKRILVVDDLRVCRESLATKLSLFSFETVAVSSVDEAWQRLSSGEAFDLVVADELMPGKGGLDLLTAMRTDPRTERVPFVLLSLFGSDHAAVADRPYQPDAIGLKPIRALKLAKLLDKVLTGDTPRSANASRGVPGGGPPSAVIASSWSRTIPSISASRSACCRNWPPT